MLFPTVQFGIFFTIVLAVSWALMSRPRLWKPFILIASYIFYGAASWRFCFLLGGITLGNQLAAVLISRTEDERARKLLLGLAVGLDLGTLGVFKYYGFFAQQSDALPPRWSGTAVPPCADLACRSGSASSPSRRSPTWSTSSAAWSRRPA